MLNIFNFDPSMYYGWGNTSIIHPFMNYFSGPLSFLAGYLFDNMFFLVLQSVINALSVVMLYYYLRKSGSSNPVALLFAVFFGVSSYNIFTAMIPDSYPYVQFIIILSVLYLQYSRMHDKATILPNASLALLNFAATSTNIIPFTGAMFFNMAFFLLSARYLAQINHTFLKKALVVIVLIFMLTTLGNNIIKHIEALNYIEKSYSVLKNAGAKT